MKSMKKIMTTTLALILALSLTACGNKQKPAEPTKETSTKVSTQEKEVTKETVTFQAKLKSFDPKTSTPLIVKVKEDKKETYVVPKVTPKEKSKTDEYTIETPVESKNAEVTLFVPPVNADGSMYEIPKEPIKEEKSVELKLIPKDKVTEEQIKTVLDNTKKAVENGCDELTINEKNKLMEKQVENTNKADVKKGKESAKPEKVKETGEEAAASTKDIPSVAVEKDPVVEVKPTTPAKPDSKPTKPDSKPAPKKPNNPAPTKPNNPTPTPEKKKVWVEEKGHWEDVTEQVWVPNIVTEDVYEDQTVMIEPEQTVKHEKWEIRYLYFYASSEEKVYNENDYNAEEDRLTESDQLTNSTWLTEYHEGPLDNPDFYEWKTDISTYETIPAKYETKHVKTGTKQVDKGSYQTKVTGRKWVVDVPGHYE